jgi:hypothetical protein
MASASSQLIEEVIAHAQMDSLEDAREICARITYVNVFIFHTRRCAVHSDHFIAGEASHTI